MSGTAWQFCVLVPNLHLVQPIGTDYIALVPYEDERLQYLSRGNPALSSLLNGFTDEYGRSQRPSGIIARESLPPEMVIDFRNLVAISCIIEGAQASLISRATVRSITPVEFADYFDLYPTTPVEPPGKGLLTRSYVGIAGGGAVEKFRGQISPLLLCCVDQTIPIPDGAVLSLLVRKWESHWQEDCGRDLRSQRLFRSLQLAFHAATMLSKNGASSFDFGVSIIHWISGIEILLHPGNSSVNEIHILNSLARLSWSRPELRVSHGLLPQNRRKHRCRIENCPHKVAEPSKLEAVSVNLIQFLYHQLYRARNMFIHGNELRPAPFLSPLENLAGPNWLTVAPLIFKAALLCFLGDIKADEAFESALAEIIRQAPAFAKTEQIVESRGAS